MLGGPTLSYQKYTNVPTLQTKGIIFAVENGKDFLQFCFEII